MDTGNPKKNALIASCVKFQPAGRSLVNKRLILNTIYCRTNTQNLQ